MGESLLVSSCYRQLQLTVCRPPCRRGLQSLIGPVGLKPPWEVCGTFPLASNFSITFGMIFIIN